MECQAEGDLENHKLLNDPNKLGSGPTFDEEATPDLSRCSCRAAVGALDRIVIPPDVAERISGMILPRSSLIISDEPLSPETGKGTDFVMVLSGERQGGIKH